MQPGDRIGSALAEAAVRLREGGVDKPMLKAEHLFADQLACPRLELTLRRDDTLNADDNKALADRLTRLAAGEPLQYVLGTAEFMGLTLHLDRNTLIPRPETEWLVEAALNDTGLWELPAPRILDLGTGSGCIAIALAAYRPHVRVTASDISRETLDRARRNAERLVPNGSFTWMPADGPEPLPDRAFDAIVTNPPYVPDAAWAALPREIRDFEPRQALAAGADGLDLIRRIVHEAPRILTPGGRLFLECGEDQTEPVRDLAEQAGFTDLAIVHDLAERPRIVKGRLPD